jgi:hypothetical protein
MYTKINNLNKYDIPGPVYLIWIVWPYRENYIIVQSQTSDIKQLH